MKATSVTPQGCGNLALTVCRYGLALLWWLAPSLPNARILPPYSSLSVQIPLFLGFVQAVGDGDQHALLPQDK